MSRMCTRRHQYSLCASPKNTKGRKTRRQKVDETEPATHLIHHTLKVPVVANCTRIPELAIGDHGKKKKPSCHITLKRKGEIRDILRASDEGYLDNFFDSTPLRTRKPNKYPITDILIEDPDVDENDTNLHQHIPFQSVNRNSNTTPVNVHYVFASPPTLSAAVKRKNADVIILQMQKSKRCRKHVNQAVSKTSTHSNGTAKKNTKVVNTDVFDNAVTKVDDGNLSSEDDSYFSNIEDD